MNLNPFKNVTIKLVKKLSDDSFRCVNEVVIGAPYNVDKDLMDHFKVGSIQLSSNINTGRNLDVLCAVICNIFCMESRISA